MSSLASLRTHRIRLSHTTTGLRRYCYIQHKIVLQKLLVCRIYSSETEDVEQNQIQHRHRTQTALTGFVTVALLFVGYWFIYLTTPHDLLWHLHTSMRRLVLQVWPSLVFSFFMIMKTPEEAMAGDNAAHKGEII